VKLAVELPDNVVAVVTTPAGPVQVNRFEPEDGAIGDPVSDNVTPVFTQSDVRLDEIDPKLGALSTVIYDVVTLDALQPASLYVADKVYTPL
jgi:hypothetical protein